MACHPANLRLVAARPASARSWSNDDFSQFYRIQRALALANLETCIDCGVTDEGDQWIAFCRRDGDVIIHIGHFDGRYHLSAPALLKSRSGVSLSELVDPLLESIRAELIRFHGDM